MSRTIRALRLSGGPHRLALAAIAGKLRPELARRGRFSALELTEIPRPQRRPGWVRIAPTLGGICGSDQKMLKVTGMGMTLMPLYPVPSQGVVLGHEIVGTVMDADPASGLAEGDRVVAVPPLSCRHRGLDSCPRCESGDDHQCQHWADAGGLPEHGPGFGFNARYGGGWAEELVAPSDRVSTVPEDLDDRSAVLAEPTAVGVHAILRDPPNPGSRVLVIGPGSIGLCLTLGLRTLCPDVHLTVAGIGHFADDLATRAGADALLHGTHRELVSAAGEQLDTTVRGNRISGLFLEDGFDQIYDTVAVEQTIDDSLRMLRPGGQLVLVGTAAKQSMDWSLVWHRDLRIRGSVYYGLESVPDGAAVTAGRRRALDVALDVLHETRPGHLVTHVFPLDEYEQALDTAAAGPAASALKVAFAPQE